MKSECQPPTAAGGRATPAARVADEPRQPRGAPTTPHAPSLDPARAEPPARRRATAPGTAGWGPESAQEAALPRRANPPNARPATETAGSPGKTGASASPQAESGSKLETAASLRRLLARARAAPDDLDRIAALSEGIQRAAEALPDRARALRVNRLVRAAEAMGDVDELAAALDELTR